MKSAYTHRSPARPRGLLALALVASLLAPAGCQQVPVWQQERVSKANMVFQDRGAFVYGPQLNTRLEPGAAASGGAPAAGCTACK